MLAFPLFAKLAMSLSPLPPTPIPATLSMSLGARKPFPPSTWRGTMVTAAAASPAVFIKFLLLTCSAEGGVDFFKGMVIDLVVCCSFLVIRMLLQLLVSRNQQRSTRNELFKNQIS